MDEKLNYLIRLVKILLLIIGGVVALSVWLAYEMSSPPLEAFSPGPPVAGPSPEEIERVVRQVVSEILESRRTYS